MFAHSVKIMSLQGFDIKVDPSWILIASLITWSLATQYFPTQLPGAEAATHMGLALIAMIGFFASLILHELAHSVVARRYGVEIKGITLFLFGGVAELGSEPKTAGSEFLIALAGPLMSFGLALGFWCAGLMAGPLGFTLIAAAASYLALVNLVLALFNMVPAFPLDGGRIYRAYLWGRNGDFLDATRIATNVGAVFAYVLMGLGVLSLFAGGLVAGMWQILIGLFLLAAARGTYQQEFTKSAFTNKMVAAMMTANPVTASPDDTLSHLVNRVMLHHRVSFVPIVEKDVLLGYVDGDVLAKIDREHWPSTKVGDVFVPVSPENSVVKKLPAQQLMRRVAETKRRKFLVVENGKLAGVITLSDLLGYLSLLQEMHIGPSASLKVTP